MSMAAFIFDTKRTRQMRAAIARMEHAVEDKRAETVAAECRLREQIKQVAKELDRPPLAGALAWRGHNGHD